MKKLIILLVLVLLTYNISESKTPYYQGRVTFHTFYYSLAPYGEWIEIDYGVYAWRPISISVGWSPYLVGRWVWTPYGWYWDSFEPFGWAVYHYGRWYYDDYYGWIWIPDYEWAPAWVEWRYTDFYIGWAPLPPYASFSISIGIRFSVKWYSPYYYWNFVPVQYFSGYEVHRYVVAPKYKYRIYGESRHSVYYKYDNGRIINLGVDRYFIERKGGRIFEAKVEETSRLRDFTERQSNERNRVLLYRPDEREINRDVEVRVRKSDRQISLDVNKIQTLRERIEIHEKDRTPMQNDGNRRENYETINRDRELKQQNDERTRLRIEEKRIETPRNERPEMKNENQRRQIFQEENKINRNYEFERNRDKDKYNQMKIEMRDENNRNQFERNKEPQRFENENRSPSLNPRQVEIRKRDLEERNSRSTERRRER